MLGSQRAHRSLPFRPSLTTSSFPSTEYKDLETRVDALKNVHTQMLKITGVYTTESYDYPTQIVESVGEGFGQLSYGFNTFAQKNLKVRRTTTSRLSSGCRMEESPLMS